MDCAPHINKAYVLIVVSLEFTSKEQALAGTSVSEEVSGDDETVTLVDAIRIVNNINTHSVTPDWAARFGNHLGIATHGPVGYAAVSAPTIGRALTTFVTWFRVRCECYDSNIVEKDESFEIHIVDTTGDEAFKTFFFASCTRACEVLIGLLAGNDKDASTQLFFETRADNRKALLEKVYDSLLHFGAETNKLVVPKALWYRSSPLSDRDSHALNLSKCQQMADSLAQRNRLDITVRNLIRNSIEASISGQSGAGSLPSLKRVSDILHQSERSMVRKLHQSGTSYKHILESQRKHYADKLLMDARYTVADISDKLGYREAASFCRAFKGWFGMSPTAYRRRPAGPDSRH